MLTVFAKDNITYLSKNNADKVTYKSTYTVTRNIMAMNTDNLFKMYRSDNYNKRIKLGGKFTSITLLPDGRIEKNYNL